MKGLRLTDKEDIKVFVPLSIIQAVYKKDKRIYISLQKEKFIEIDGEFGDINGLYNKIISIVGEELPIYINLSIYNCTFNQLMI